MRLRLDELTQPLIALLMLGGLIAAVFQIVAPFLAATLWAVILVSATWGPFRWLSSRLGDRDGLAASLIVCALMLFVLIPLVLASVEFAQQLTELARSLPERVHAGLPPRITSYNVCYTKLLRCSQRSAASSGRSCWVTSMSSRSPTRLAPQSVSRRSRVLPPSQKVS